MTSSITPELRELIEPHLKECLLEEDWQYIDDMFSEVVYTYPNGVGLVTLKPHSDYVPAMEFSTVTGEFVELTDWDYVQTVDAEAQLVEEEQRIAMEATISALKHYHKLEYQTITDYDKVIDSRVELTVNSTTLYKYDCPCQTIYLKADNYPITYDRQKVVGDYYYYNFSDNTPTSETEDELDLYKYKVKYEWKRNTNIWE